MKLGKEILALDFMGAMLPCMGQFVCIAVSSYYYVGISLHMQT